MDATLDSGLLLTAVVALAAGAIIGIERGWHTREAAQGTRVAGARTFALIALLGDLVGGMPDPLAMPMVLSGHFALTLLVAVSYFRNASVAGDAGITTEIAMLITFGLGVIAARGLLMEAIALATMTSVVLNYKPQIHRLIEIINQRELAASLQLLVVGVVLLPLLPTEPVGPFGGVNLRTIGLLAFLVLGLSFAGYVAMRIFGGVRGVFLTAALGGLTSSTAVTLAYGRMAARNPELAAMYSIGIAIASAVMSARVLVEVAIVNFPLAYKVALPLLLISAVPILSVVYVVKHLSSEQPKAHVSLNNPLDLEGALLVTVLLVVFTTLVRVTGEHYGNSGLYAVSALSGLVDVDAISLSLAQSSQSSMSRSLAAQGIVIAVIVNTLFKALIAIFLGGVRAMKWCTIPLAVSAIFGASWLFIL